MIQCVIHYLILNQKMMLKNKLPVIYNDMAPKLKDRRKINVLERRIQQLEREQTRLRRQITRIKTSR